MIEDRLVHHRQPDKHREAVARDRLHGDDGIEPTHQRHLAADREIAEQQDMAGAVEQRKLSGDAVVAGEAHFHRIAHHRHDHREVTMHRALGTRSGAAGVDDHGEIALVELDLGLDVGVPGDELREAAEPLRRRRSRQVDGDQIEAATRQRRPPVRLGVEAVVDHGETHFGMVENVVGVRRSKHGVDRNPDQPCAMDAEQRFDELHRVVADRRDLLAGFQAAGEQVVGEPVGVAIELGKRHLAFAVGQRNAIRETAGRAAQNVADRHPPDTSRARNAARCRKITHRALLIWRTCCRHRLV